MEYLGMIFLILILIAINAFFAASEIAIISVRKTMLRTLGEKKAGATRSVERLLQKPSEFLATIQVGVTLAGFFASATGAISLAQDLGEKLEKSGLPLLETAGKEIAFVLVTVIISFITLVLGELVPKRIALANPERISFLVARPIEALSLVFRPVIVVLSFFTDSISKFLGISQDKIGLVTEEELKIFLSEQKALPPEERQLINEVFDFGDTMAYEVMTPRTDIVAVDEEATVKDVLEVFRKNHYSRIPVFREDIDHIVGFVHIKDILVLYEEGMLDKKVKEILRPVYFVPATKKVIELLREMQRRRVHMAIVLDEYGGTAGLVTIEDLLEELVGEIRDEHDREAAPYRKVGENEYLVDASIQIEELNELLGLDIPESEEFESVGGLVMELLDKVPEEGEVVKIGRYLLKVERMRGKRIITLRLIVESDEEEGKEENVKTDTRP
ncbi:hemolysin family protein [Atrimonas thermophila]|uniref:hemolysin family protein n=1 Tax=Atrimonas thermophila TaxID=3064161 RepID=UPI00399CBADF